ncbi:MAG TPA: class I SAM-dependent methyltransferase [Candidatus Nanoarchaeia archaeon]|nr:class I SAM-dependent methyltransferase [Candidatus Nanoarchaeia archaeon]
MDEYFRGKKLYGDDFGIKQIKEWYDEEKEGYSNLEEIEDYTYKFHALNGVHGYEKIKDTKKFDKVLAFGAAFGDELLPIINKINEIYIVEPSEKLRAQKIGEKKPVYVTPEISGRIKFPDNSFDLVTCFGVLHHIPNVSFVLQEMVRVTKPGGIILVREPIVSMGDWRKPRSGLTKRERGIPLDFFRRLIKDNNLEIVSERLVLFPLLRRMDFDNHTGGNSRLIVKLDYLLSKMFSWNNKYHATNIFHKIRPQSIFYVLQKN